jgi:hypothetical protein
MGAGELGDWTERRGNWGAGELEEICEWEQGNWGTGPRGEGIGEQGIGGDL